jgi:hypothetical protein
MRLSAYLCVEIELNAENAKIRREPQRKFFIPPLVSPGLAQPSGDPDTRWP